MRETLLFLALIGILIPLLQRQRVNQALGFLIAGTLLGQGGEFTFIVVDYASGLHLLDRATGKFMLLVVTLSLPARSRDEKHALALRQAGATFVISQTLETGLQLSAFVLQTLGVEEGVAAHTIQVERERRIADLLITPSAAGPK